MDVALARGVRERLRGLYLKEEGLGLSQRKLAERIPISFQTVNGWFSNRPAMPAVAALVALAKRDNLNLNHLLLNEGPPLRGQLAMPESLEGALQAHVLAELGRDAEVREVEDVLRLRGSLLRFITEHLGREVQGLRRIRQQILADAAEARRDLVGQNEEAKLRWIRAGQTTPSTRGSFNVPNELPSARGASAQETKDV